MKWKTEVTLIKSFTPKKKSCSPVKAAPTATRQKVTSNRTGKASRTKKEKGPFLMETLMS